MIGAAGSTMVAPMSRSLLIAVWLTVAIYGARQAIHTFREEMWDDDNKVWFGLVCLGVFIAFALAGDGGP